MMQGGGGAGWENAECRGRPRLSPIFIASF